MTATIKAKLQEVAGIEIRDEQPAGAKVFLGTFYQDELELLISAARSLRDRTKHFIAPDGTGFAIYTKEKTK